MQAIVALSTVLYTLFLHVKVIIALAFNSLRKQATCRSSTNMSSIVCQNSSVESMVKESSSSSSLNL